MGHKPFHRRTWRTVREVIVLTVVFALIATPVLVVLTHGPAAHANVASAPAETAGGITAHSHAHSHSHAHQHGHKHHESGHGHEGGLFGGHNPADHDHPLHAVIGQAANALKPLPDKAQYAFSDVFQNLTLEGPRRPPRSV